jgi:quinol monooxygenase YgiN
MMYLFQGKFNTKAGQADELVRILLEASNIVSAVKGCKVYAISKDARDPTAVYVTEIWASKEDHDNSLNTEGIRALINKALPLLDELPTPGQELEVVGGAGI